MLAPKRDGSISCEMYKKSINWVPGQQFSESKCSIGTSCSVLECPLLSAQCHFSPSTCSLCPYCAVYCCIAQCFNIHLNSFNSNLDIIVYTDSSIVYGANISLVLLEHSFASRSNSQRHQPKYYYSANTQLLYKYKVYV